MPGNHNFNTASLSTLLNRPVTVGNQILPHRLLLAPMAFVGNIAFRALVAQFGGYGLLSSEMCDAKRIPYENINHSLYFRFQEPEKKEILCQIVGSDPEIMARAARRIENEGIFGVDINFGCANKMICKQNAGAALLKNPDLAVKIVATVRKAISIPLFVKFRIGWTDTPTLTVELAKRFEDAGVDAITFHPRIAPDIRTRKPKWEYIRFVKDAVSIPVFGNGNIFDAQICAYLINTIGCDGVSLGRLALAKPWIFAEWTGQLTQYTEIYHQSIRKLIDLHEKFFNQTHALHRIKRILQYFCSNFQFGHHLFKTGINAKGISDLRKVVDQFFNTQPRLAMSLNMNHLV